MQLTKRKQIIWPCKTIDSANTHTQAGFHLIWAEAKSATNQYEQD